MSLYNRQVQAEISAIPQLDTVISARSPWSDSCVRRNQQRLLLRGSTMVVRNQKAP
ncbi:hypothetical protein ANCCAN_08944 [Ancylostoma caninum]|uniref:Uncharacterized protein n=1 Tax=Ancylostoma caninum TaxID=29170 RepID=A0A368GKV4_ANCCA|nr:hypothetical protein ANCCAN_08944 [Ancylostoma caninum]